MILLAIVSIPVNGSKPRASGDDPNPLAIFKRGNM